MNKFINKGFSTVEFLIAAIPCLLLSLICFEFTRWYQYKQVLNLALLEASRQAMVKNADFEIIEKTFNTEALPLFVSKSATKLQKKTYAKNWKLIGRPWEITVHSPTCKDLKKWHDSSLVFALPLINNNYQKEQAELKSDTSIYDANTLDLELIYPYKPVVPGVQILISTLLGKTSSDIYKDRIFSHGYLPIKTRVRVTMHSHPLIRTGSWYQNVRYAKNC